MTQKKCKYCGNKAEYLCKIKKINLCENCRVQHLHEIQKYIFEVIE